MQDMTPADRMRLRAHPRSHSLFKMLVTGLTEDGLAARVANLTPTQYKQLRTLLELGYVTVEDGRLVVEFTVSSLAKLDYI